VKLNDWLEKYQQDEAGQKKVVMAVCGNTDLEIAAVSDDTRTLSPGSLFVAVKGSMEDGHQHIEAAIGQGTAIVIQEEPLLKPASSQQESPTLVRVADSKKARAHLAAEFFGHPAAQLCLIGITGTNGKTTTATLIHAMLQKAGFKTGLLSTICTRFGERETKSERTTPGILALQRCFSEMRASAISHVVMEVSSHALEQGRVSGCNYELSIFTNLTQDHLDYHKTMSRYFEAKKRLFLQTSGRALINIDDEWGRKLQADFSEKTWSYGIDRNADICPLKFKSSAEGIWMMLRTPEGEMEIRSPLMGRYNIYNLLATVGAGLFLGLSKSQVSAGIASLKGISGRFEKIDQGQNFMVIVDYAHSPDALFRLLAALKEMAASEIITVFGCGGDRDRDKRAKMGAVAAAFSDKIILSSDNPRTERPLEILKEIEAGIPEAKKCATECIEDRKEAIFRAVHLARKGDVVVIAGKGHEGEQIVGDLRIPFDDRIVARLALSERAQVEKSAGQKHVADQ